MRDIILLKCEIFFLGEVLDRAMIWVANTYIYLIFNHYVEVYRNKGRAVLSLHLFPTVLLYLIKSKREEYLCAYPFTLCPDYTTPFPPFTSLLFLCLYTYPLIPSAPYYSFSSYWYNRLSTGESSSKVNEVDTDWPKCCWMFRNFWECSQNPLEYSR